MQLILIVAVLAALAASDYGPSQPVSGPTVRLAIVLAAVALVVWFALVVSRSIARQLDADFSRRRLLLKRFRILRRTHTVLWLGSVAGISFGLGWGQLVRFNWRLDHAFLADELLILLPILLPLVLSWAAFYEVDRTVRLAACDGAEPRRRPPSRRQYLALHMRHYLGMLLVPVLGILAVRDAMQLCMPSLIEEGYEAVVFLPALAVLFLLFPLLLRHVWQTRPLQPGPTRSRLEAAARRSGFHARDILVWDTNATVVNAAVAGFARPLRYVFLTDALLSRLDEEEIEAVFGHEMGHVRHHHLLLRVATVFVPLSVWLLLQAAYPQAAERLSAWVQGSGLALQVPLGLVLLGAMGVYVLVVFGYYSRQLEHQADLFGCRSVALSPQHLSPQHRRVEIFASALEKLALGGGVGRNTRSWQHASVARRVEFLNILSHEPKRELHFHRRVRLLNGLVIGIMLSPLVYQLLLG